MLTLEFPQIFWALPLPLLVYLLWPAAKRDDSALLVPFYQQLADGETSARLPGNTPKLKLLLLSLIWCATVVACARPMWVGDPINLPASGRDLLLAVDISGSMETPDMNWQGQAIDRLTTVKKVVGEFVLRRESDRLGLILFGTRAYLQTPLTFDRNTVDRLLQEAQLGFAGEKTAIGDAIALSVKRLRERPQESRVLILLTDGANTAGEIDPLKAAELAAQFDVKIYTVGIGADEMLKPGLFGSRFGARRVNPSVDLDEESLQAIAHGTGGQYFRARSLEDLEKIYAVLDTLEPSEQDAEVFRPTRTLFHWPLGLAMLLSGMWLVAALLNTVRESGND